MVTASYGSNGTDIDLGEEYKFDLDNDDND
jgi:hypothetical protein